MYHLLHRIYQEQSPNCTRCLSEEGTYFHMFWTWPRVAQFWTHVFDLINTCLQLSLPCTPELALLGIHNYEQRPRYTKLLISYLLYYAKKETLFKWASPSPPILASWESNINRVLPMYKLTYINRKVWQNLETMVGMLNLVIYVYVSLIAYIVVYMADCADSVFFHVFFPFTCFILCTFIPSWWDSLLLCIPVCIPVVYVPLICSNKEQSCLLKKLYHLLLARCIW